MLNFLFVDIGSLVKIVNGDCFVMDTRQKNMSVNDLTHPADFGLPNLFLFISFFSFVKVLFLCLSLLNST